MYVCMYVCMYRATSVQGLCEVPSLQGLCETPPVSLGKMTESVCMCVWSLQGLTKSFLHRTLKSTLCIGDSWRLLSIGGFVNPLWVLQCPLYSGFVHTYIDTYIHFTLFIYWYLFAYEISWVTIMNYWILKFNLCCYFNISSQESGELFDSVLFHNRSTLILQLTKESITSHYILQISFHCAL